MNSSILPISSFLKSKISPLKDKENEDEEIYGKKIKKRILKKNFSFSSFPLKNFKRGIDDKNRKKNITELFRIFTKKLKLQDLVSRRLSDQIEAQFSKNCLNEEYKEKIEKFISLLKVTNLNSFSS